MHEVGHNLGLRHAFENGTEYEDRTGYMGSMPNMTRYPEQCEYSF
jgi:Gametolysin peptidase M11